MYCPHCGAKNDDTAKFCRKCSSNIENEVVIALAKDKKYCANCGAENMELSRHCIKCGKKFHVERDYSGISSAIKFIAIIAFFIIIIYAAYWLYKNNGHAGGVLAGRTTTTIYYNPQFGTSYNGDITYNSNIALSGDVATTGNVYIGKDAILVTEGYGIIAGGVFNNSGKIYAGNPGDTAMPENSGRSYLGSFGGSGGSGGGGTNFPGGWNGTSSLIPNITAIKIQSMYLTGFVSYLTGAGGGGACLKGGHAANGGRTVAQGGTIPNTLSSFNQCASTGGSNGVSGSYGIYIQANRVIAGYIDAEGLTAQPGTLDAGGGGGGGTIIIAYGPKGYVPGNYFVNGGAGQQDGGAGGSGLVLTYQYNGIPPISP